MKPHIDYLTFAKTRLSTAIATAHNDPSKLETDGPIDDPARTKIRDTLLPKIDTFIRESSDSTTLADAARFFRDNILNSIDTLKLKRPKAVFWYGDPTFLGTQIASALTDIQDKFTELQAAVQAQKIMNQQLDVLATQKASQLVDEANRLRLEKEKEAEEANRLRAEKEKEAEEANRLKAEKEKEAEEANRLRAEKEKEAEEANRLKAEKEEEARLALERAKNAEALAEEETQAREQAQALVLQAQELIIETESRADTAQAEAEAAERARAMAEAEKNAANERARAAEEEAKEARERALKAESQLVISTQSSNQQVVQLRRQVDAFLEVYNSMALFYQSASPEVIMQATALLDFSVLNSTKRPLYLTEFSALQAEKDRLRTEKESTKDPETKKKVSEQLSVASKNLDESATKKDYDRIVKQFTSLRRQFLIKLLLNYIGKEMGGTQPNTAGIAIADSIIFYYLLQAKLSWEETLLDPNNPMSTLKSQQNKKLAPELYTAIEKADPDLKNNADSYTNVEMRCLVITQDSQFPHYAGKSVLQIIAGNLLAAYKIGSTGGVIPPNPVFYDVCRDLYNGRNLNPGEALAGITFAQVPQISTEECTSNIMLN